VCAVEHGGVMVNVVTEKIERNLKSVSSLEKDPVCVCVCVS